MNTYLGLKFEFCEGGGSFSFKWVFIELSIENLSNL